MRWMVRDGHVESRLEEAERSRIDARRKWKDGPGERRSRPRVRCHA